MLLLKKLKNGHRSNLRGTNTLGVFPCLFLAFVISLLGFSDVGHAQVCKHPFPNHTQYTAGTIKPNFIDQAGLDNAVRTFYTSWKKTHLRNNCADPSLYYVYDNEEKESGKIPGTICVSEGQGYGMLIAAYMAGCDTMARTYFDGLFRFARAHPSCRSPFLMSWDIVNGCKTLTAHDNNYSASDGDLDIAYALLLADAQWGNDGAVNYRLEALKTIDAIMEHEVNVKKFTVTLSDALDTDDPQYFDVRTSDFMPGHFKVFYMATGDNRWLKVHDACYGLVGEFQKKFSPETGLLPDFIQYKNASYRPAKPQYLESPHDGCYYYNACRVPMRLGIDYLVNGEKKALPALEKINAWVKKMSGGNPEKVYSGFYLNGKNLRGSDYVTPAFIAPFTLGAMTNSKNQEWLNSLCRSLLAFRFNDFKYYDNSIKMLCLLAMSGNLWSPVPDKNH